MELDEIIKITQRYLLKPPILLLLLTNWKRGPSFLRVVLSVFHENADRVPDVMLINDAGDAYGTYIYANPADRPKDEKAWYDLLTKDTTTIDDLIHFWRQFCLNWVCVVEDLQKLSKRVDGSLAEGVVPFVRFQ